MNARRWIDKLRYRGPGWALQAVRNRVMPFRLHGHRRWSSRFAGARALEIGGPSPVFEKNGLLPIYHVLEKCDNVQFAAETSWQGAVPDGTQIGRGTQLVREAGRLSGLADAAYDLVLASHVLEHTANPLATLREWRRVTGLQGGLVVIVPEGSRMWDHNRPMTTLGHLLADDSAAMAEDDLSHLEEVLTLSDWTWFEEPHRADASFDDFKLNSFTRTMHHHVFDAQLLDASLARAGWLLSQLERVWPHHLVAIASPSGESPSSRR